MGAISKSLALLSILLIIASYASSHYHHSHHAGHKRENYGADFAGPSSTLENKQTTVQTESSEENKKHPATGSRQNSNPFSKTRIDKMMAKALLKIITGDLSTADMELLKSLNYTCEEVLAIREYELKKQKDEGVRKHVELKTEKVCYNGNLHEREVKRRKHDSIKLKHAEKNKNRRREKDYDYDAYNRQALIDYENMATKFEKQRSQFESTITDYDERSAEQDASQESYQKFDSIMKPHVIFKIRYDDSEFDFDSEEGSKFVERSTSRNSKERKHRVPPSRHETAENAGSLRAPSFSPVTEFSPLPIVYLLKNSKENKLQDYPENQSSSSTDSSVANADFTLNGTSDETTDRRDSTNDTSRKIARYEGLEWVEDDVYKVKPEDLLCLNDADDNGTLDCEEQTSQAAPEESGNDTSDYQNDVMDAMEQFMAMANINRSSQNSSSANMNVYQQMILINRETEKQKTINNIGNKVLVLRERSQNHSIETNKFNEIQPTCQIPRNTDPETWTDPFSMNLHFQLNLTSDQEVKYAILRIYKLPQENATTSASGGLHQVEGGRKEKTINISVYYYTKSLKKHRSKKKFLISKMESLTTNGVHMALDVKEALVFWMSNTRNSHGNGNNHGMVIQIEDENERLLKPALYIQQSLCENQNSEQKASGQPINHELPALFIYTCPTGCDVNCKKKKCFV